MVTLKQKWNPDIELECLVVGVHFPGFMLKGAVSALDDELNGKITELLRSNDISPKKKSITVIPTFGQVKTKRILFVGLGKEKTVAEEDWKEGLAKAFRKVKEMRLSSVAVDLESLSGQLDPERAASLLGEVYMESLYTLQTYKRKPNKPIVHIEKMYLYSEYDSVKIQKSIDKGFVYGKSTNYARTLVNMPPNLLTAPVLADYAQKLGDTYGMEVEILDKTQMEELGMGALLAVNQGSTEPPAMIVLKYQGKDEWKDVIALVGKGVTYDTGGYSLKPRDGLIGMKGDMGGAAAVLGAMQIIGEMKPAQNVVAVIASTDNMISAAAFKPDDVITSLSGKTIEVLNTDAEGRLALADAVTYSKQHGADYIVDIATLTGGVVVALGKEMTGAFTNNEQLLKQVQAASLMTGEPMWQLPITKKDRERVKNSLMADLNNSPGREGHAIMGAAFVGEFTEGTPWVHLDIAGTSMTKQPNEQQTYGATGVMVKTLAQLVLDFVPFS
ncbi:leucyl aminopeptidase [Bacillus testis]|uniref:leucyl aminopeptidase n=1 Tax=Bacillus testis TaxID=1622072 RepID=UPI00067E8445|nr:leucyl aminopeptidase [Bacillus testis]